MEAKKEVQVAKLAELSDKESVARAGTLTEALIKFSNRYCKDNNLSPEELIFAAALFTINLRETYPGGKTQFDGVAAGAAEYYDANA